MGVLIQFLIIRLLPLSVVYHLNDLKIMMKNYGVQLSA